MLQLNNYDAFQSYNNNHIPGCVLFLMQNHNLNELTITFHWKILFAKLETQNTRFEKPFLKYALMRVYYKNKIYKTR